MRKGDILMNLSTKILIGLAIINFLIIALVVFFLIKLVNKMMPKKETEEDDPTPTNEEIYLRQIRDLLQEKTK